jgi:DNA-binding NarL/FixJ family response regulator
MRILVVDGRNEIRSALRALLEQERGLDIIAEGTDAEGVIELAKQTNPDAILFDSACPPERMGHLLLSIKAALPTVRIVVLSVRLDIERIALRCGADAFVSKFDPPTRLLDTLFSLRDQHEARTPKA